METRQILQYRAPHNTSSIDAVAFSSSQIQIKLLKTEQYKVRVYIPWYFLQVAA